MAPDIVEVEHALLALAPAQRAAVIDAGLLSLDENGTEDSPEDIGAAWRDEVTDRLDDVLQGQVALGSFETTRARFAAKYPAPSSGSPAP